MAAILPRSLCLALGAAGAMAAAGAAHAVSVSADGRGQVLLYPYYTARTDANGNPFGTLMSVVNGEAAAKAVRVRFLEGRNGREVLSFNLFLSAGATWAAAIVPDAGGGAKVGTLAASCTLPSIAASPFTPYVPFANVNYAGPNDDGAGADLDRAKEGFIEVIEMSTYMPASATGTAITPVAGIPHCGSALTDAQAAADAGAPTGGLHGTVTFTNPASGNDFHTDAIALADFYQVGSNYHASGTPLPDLTQASPPVSIVQTGDGASLESRWTPGSADAVSAVLMHDSIMNDYAASSRGAGTDWVVTLPTKRFYMGRAPGSATHLFEGTVRDGGAVCDDVQLLRREGDRRDATGRPSPVVPPTGVKSYALCWATNVFTVGDSVLGASGATRLPVAPTKGQVTMRFPPTPPGREPAVHRLISTSTSLAGAGRNAAPGNTVAYKGLPVIGFAVLASGESRVQAGGAAADGVEQLVQKTGKRSP